MAVRVRKGLVGLSGSGTAWQFGRGRFGFGQASYGSAVKVGRCVFRHGQLRYGGYGEPRSVWYVPLRSVTAVLAWYGKLWLEKLRLVMAVLVC